MAKKGFDGFVLSLGTAETNPAARTAVLTLAATLRQRYPDKHLLLDLRLGLGIESIHVADGFLALGVYTREGRNGAVDWTPIAEVQRSLRLIRKVQMQGMRVFASISRPPMTARPAVKPRSASPAWPCCPSSPRLL